MSSRRSNGYVHAPIDKCGCCGLWIRHILLKLILDGTPTSLTFQSYRTEWLTRVMGFFSFLGTEDCFTCIIPLLTWILDARLGKLFTILLSLGFYAVGFLKCLLCLPRPPSPPVTPLHKEDGDWALPSNHATVALLVPWYLWIYSYLHYDWWPWWAPLLLFPVALTWFGGVTLSRLYLGVHSVADMVVGEVLGVCILSAFLLMDDYIDYEAAEGDYVIPKAATLVTVLLYIHPRTNPETSSYGESMLLLGSAFGVILSRRITFGGSNRPSLLQSVSSFDQLPWLVLLWRSLLRLVIGTIMIVGGRIVLKALFRRIVYRFYSFFELPAYVYKDYALQFPSTTKHYTAAYRLPPLAGCKFQVGLDDDGREGHNSLDGVNERRKVTNRVNGKILPVTTKGAASAHSDYTTMDCHLDSDFQDGVMNYEGAKNKSANEKGPLAPAADGSLPYDVDIPTRLIVYSILGWILGEGAPALFDLLGT